MLEAKGITNIVKKDIYNMRSKLNSETSSSEMFNFLDSLQSKGYIVRFEVNEKNQLKSLFFCHEDSIVDARRMPESIIIDATYKTNNHKLTFVNVVGTSSTSKDGKRGTLLTFAIAGAWVSNELGGTYDWVLKELKDAIWPSDGNFKAPDVIVTDNDAALKNAVEKVFPESHHLLCYWHLGNNFETNLRPCFKKGSIAQLSLLVISMRQLFTDIALCRTEKEMNNAIAAFRTFLHFSGAGDPTKRTCEKPTDIENAEKYLDK